MAKRTMKPVQADDLKYLRIINGCVLAPDGSAVATTISADDPKTGKKQSHIWLQPLPKGRLRQYTYGACIDTNPQFSPDGKTIAFISNRSGMNQVHLLALDGGEARQLTDLPAGAGQLCWAPDGKHLCIAAPRKQPEAATPVVRRVTGWSVKQLAVPWDLLLLNVHSGKLRTLVADGCANYMPTFSPDGEWVVYNANREPDPIAEPMRIDLFKMRVSGKGKPRLITTHSGPSEVPVVSPDGKWIAFSGFPDAKRGWDVQTPSLFITSFSGGAVRSLSGHLDRSVQPLLLSDTWGHSPLQLPQWSPDSREVCCLVHEGGATNLHRFGLDGCHQRLLCGEGAVLNTAIDYAGQRIAAVCSDPQTPCDIYLGPLSGGACRRLTRVNQWLGRRNLGRYGETRTAAGGGPHLDGWILTPPDFNPHKKYPGILYIHGGPMHSYARVFMHEFNYLAGQGYVVFYCNPRGGQGYGVEFKAAIHNAWGTVDYDDVMRFTDHVLRKYKFIDAKRLGVTGGSYGGYLTNWIIGHTHRFKAAVTQRSVSNFVSWCGNALGTGLAVKSRFEPERTPRENLEHIWQMSPVAHLHNAKTPTLVVHGENDTLTSQEQGQQIYGLLKAFGVETELLLFPEEGHELSRSGRLDRRVSRLEGIREWFDRYLK